MSWVRVISVSPRVQEGAGVGDEIRWMGRNGAHRLGADVHLCGRQVEAGQAVGTGGRDQGTGFAIDKTGNLKILRSDVGGVEMAGENKVQSVVGQQLPDSVIAAHQVGRELLGLPGKVFDDAVVHQADHPIALLPGLREAGHHPVLGRSGEPLGEAVWSMARGLAMS